MPRWLSLVERRTHRDPKGLIVDLLDLRNPKVTGSNPVLGIGWGGHPPPHFSLKIGCPVENERSGSSLARVEGDAQWGSSAVTGIRTRARGLGSPCPTRLDYDRTLKATCMMFPINNL